jgi:uncharacterized protein YkwD
MAIDKNYIRTEGRSSNYNMFASNPFKRRDNALKFARHPSAREDAEVVREARSRTARRAKQRSLNLGRLACTVLIGACSPRIAVPERPTGPLPLAAARQHVLALINADRAAAGQAPVERDEVAEAAAQAHADDMARHGYTAHWGTDGSVPEERYTLAGGVHFVQENAACFFDGDRRPLDEAARFLPDALEEIEGAFIGERPPHDGHRKNILYPNHTSVGIGLAQPVGIPQPCMAQEFVDVRGTYEPLPREIARGKSVHVAGELNDTVHFGGVGVSRIAPRKPLSVRELNATSSYLIPAPFQTYFPEGYQTPKPVRLDGRRFSIDVPLSDAKRPGRYGVSIWGTYPESENLVMLSLRIVNVR